MRTFRGRLSAYTSLWMPRSTDMAVLQKAAEGECADCRAECAKPVLHTFSVPSHIVTCQRARVHLCGHALAQICFEKRMCCDISRIREELGKCSIGMHADQLGFLIAQHACTWVAESRPSRWWCRLRLRTISEMFYAPPMVLGQAP